MNLVIENNKSKERIGGIENMLKNISMLNNPSCKPEMHNEDSMAEALDFGCKRNCLRADTNKKRRALRLGFDKNQVTHRKDGELNLRRSQFLPTLKGLGILAIFI